MDPSAFGFEIPQGSVSDIEAAVRQTLSASAWHETQAQNVRRAAAVAMARWSGPAQRGFADYVAHLIGMHESNAQVLSQGASSMAALAAGLEQAQQATRLAAQECSSCQQQLRAQQDLADEHAARARNLHAQAAVAAHPQMQAELTRQAHAAEADQRSAADAAGRAQDDLSYWQRQGQNAFSAYTDEANRIARQIIALEEDLRPVVVPHGGVPVPAAAGHSNGKLAHVAAVAAIPTGQRGQPREQADSRIVYEVIGGAVTPVVKGPTAGAIDNNHPVVKDPLAGAIDTHPVKDPHTGVIDKHPVKDPQRGLIDNHPGKTQNPLLTNGKPFEPKFGDKPTDIFGGTPRILHNSKNDDNEQGSKGKGDQSSEADPSEATAAEQPPTEISGYTNHGKEQVLGRDGGVGVSDAALRDAVQNPVKDPTQQVGQQGPTWRFIGRSATVILNRSGQVVTAWARNSGGWRNAP